MGRDFFSWILMGLNIFMSVFFSTDFTTFFDNTKYICSNITNNVELPQIVVSIDPNKFTDNVISPLDYTNEKWFINLTNIAIPTQVSNLLQLGNQFCLPPDINKNGVIHEFIKHIECHNCLLQDIDKSRIRNHLPSP